MARKSPDITVEEIFPDKKDARYPSLRAAQQAALPAIVADLTAIMREMLADGTLKRVNVAVFHKPSCTMR